MVKITADYTKTSGYILNSDLHHCKDIYNTYYIINNNTGWNKWQGASNDKRGFFNKQ